MDSMMARSRFRPKPENIALPPSPIRAHDSPTPSPSLLTIDPLDNAPSSLSPDYVPLPPNTADSPMTPVSPDILGAWPKDKWDTLGLAGPIQAAYEVGEKEMETKAPPKKQSNRIARLFMQFTILAVLIPILVGSAQYFMGASKLEMPEWKALEEELRCTFEPLCRWKWAQWCSHCVTKVLGDEDELL